ncbi:MAG: response regulator [Isosphaeraceae bacterium]
MKSNPTPTLLGALSFTWTASPKSFASTDTSPSNRARRALMASPPEGFRTFLAESGEEAIDIVKDHEVHLALMDMHLPRLSGLETIAIVRQIKGLIPTILISADRDDNLLRRALSEHAFCVLAKPVSKHVVIYVVTKALQKYYN